MTARDLVSAVRDATGHPQFPFNRHLTAGWLKHIRSKPEGRKAIREAIKACSPPIVR